MQLLRLYHTIRHLRLQQIAYRLYYPVKKRWYRPAKAQVHHLKSARSFPQQQFFTVPVYDHYDPEQAAFTLLNIRQPYPDGIDWNDARHGALWRYHLNYFQWLEDETVSVPARLRTVLDYAAKSAVAAGLDPYPVALRGIAWIRFFLRHDIRDDRLHATLYAHYHRLYAFPEYQLRGNHLWEAGCSLLWAGHYFETRDFFKKGKKILETALAEQLTADGGHIEGSPMYHSLLLLRLLQTIGLCRASPRFKDDDLLRKMTSAAGCMPGWLQQMTFSNGEWPFVNDSAPGVAPPPSWLYQYAGHLAINTDARILSGSGYRMWRSALWELFIDAANLRPAYQPGHAHADTFSFCLNIAGKPVIVDTGVSTYAPGARRSAERGTAAHNTVRVTGADSSDVWKSFRVGRRAEVTILKESAFSLSAEHNGYRHFGVTHCRSFYMEADRIFITDTLKNLKNNSATLFLHFHPDVVLTKTEGSSYRADDLLIDVEGAAAVAVKNYSFAAGFHLVRPAQCLCIACGPEVKTTLQVLNTLHAD